MVITGPSGVGKDTLLARMKERGHAQGGRTYHFAVTATTRPKRPHEREGVDYHFLSPWQFDHILARDGFLENATVYGHRYGVPRAQVREALSEGKDVLVRTDVQGATYIKSVCPQAVTVFLMPPSFQALEERLRSRAADEPQQIEMRLRIARQEMSMAGQFDHTVVNDHLEDAIASIEGIIAGEKAKPGREPTRL